MKLTEMILRNCVLSLRRTGGGGGGGWGKAGSLILGHVTMTLRSCSSGPRYSVLSFYHLKPIDSPEEVAGVTEGNIVDCGLEGEERGGVIPETKRGQGKVLPEQKGGECLCVCATG